MTERIIASTCRECFVGCGSLIHIADGKVVKIAGNPAHPHSRGGFCAKGMNAPIASLYHPKRPLQPLRRTGERGEGKFEPATWEEVLAEISERLINIKQEHGGRSLAGAVSNQYYDRGVAMSLLLRSFGSPNYMINQDLCTGSRSTAGLMTGLAAEPGSELRRSDCILVVGRSPSEANIVDWMDIRAAKQAGAKLIVIDPRETQLAKLADIWLAVRPGTDAALALSLVNELFDQQLINKDFVEKWCVGVDLLQARASKYPAGDAEEITGVAAHLIKGAAKMFASSKRSSMVLGHGIDAQANGVYTAMAFHALIALTGNVDREGSNRLAKYLPGFRDYVSIVRDPRFRMPTAREAQIIGGDKYPLWTGARSWGSAAHNPSVINAILTEDPYPIKAMYVSGVNILCTYPGMQNTIEAFKKLDLLVVATDHITPTAEYADYVLPKTTLLEERAVFAEVLAPCLSVVNRALAPLGQVKSDMEIAIALTAYLREKGGLDFDLLPWKHELEFIEYQLENTGLRYEQLEAGFSCFDFEYGTYEHTGFKTPTKKIELWSSVLDEFGYDPLPDYHAPSYASTSDGYDLLLMTGIRVMGLHHSRFRNHAWARRGQRYPQVKLHPSLAAEYEIADGDWIWIEVLGGSRRVYLHAKLSNEVPPKSLATGMGWWFPELSGADRGALRFNVEAAIPYGPICDPISGSPESRNCACRIGRATVEEMQILEVDAIGRPSDSVA